MRCRKTVKIDDREITIYELRVKDIRALFDKGDSFDGSYADLAEALKLCCDLPGEQFEDLAPSEIKIIWDAFREANTVFFDLAAKSGIVELMSASFRKRLTAFAAALSNEAINTASITDGLSSSSASRTP